MDSDEPVERGSAEQNSAARRGGTEGSGKPADEAKASLITPAFAELLGTFALVFAGTGAIVINDVQAGAIGHAGIALTFGLVVAAVIYAIGDVSGAHINPAVTLAFTVARKCVPRQAAVYCAAQCTGAIAASVAMWMLFPGHTSLGATLPAGTWQQSFVLELLLTCFLMWVILHVSLCAADKSVVAGGAVGAVVALEAMFAGPVCGASMNPARSLGPALVSGQFEYLWVYVAAPIAGACLAIPLFMLTRPSHQRDTA